MTLSLGKTNLRQVCGMLKLVYRNPGINRKQIGEFLNVDRAMITHIYNYLVENGWLLEQSSPLKRLPLVLNKDRIYTAGVELQPEYQVVVISNLRGEVVFEKLLHEKITDLLTFFYEKVLSVISESGVKIEGLGLAIPGIIDSASNRIIRSVPFGLEEIVQFPKEIDFHAEKTPVYIDNDVRCWGWGKVAFHQEDKPFFVIKQHFIDEEKNPGEIARISGGGAFFSNYKPNAGGHGCAGELPFIFRLEDFQSLHVREDERRVMKMNRDGMEKFLKNCALTVAYLSHVFDVNRVFMEGFEGMDKNFLLEKTREYLGEYRFYPDIQNTELFVEEEDIKRTAFGACGFAIEQLIVAPCESDAVESRLFQKKANKTEEQ